MKKMLVAVMVLVMLLVTVLPASAGDDLPPYPPYGPPGWSHVNPGDGGSDNPGTGPGGLTIDATLSAETNDPKGPPTGGPPGWSHENPGQGGSDNPGPGSDALTADLLLASADSGQGGPPGWSQMNPGQGGSDGPGVGSKSRLDKGGAVATGLAASDDPSPWDHCPGKRNFPVPPPWSGHEE